MTKYRIKKIPIASGGMMVNKPIDLNLSPEDFLSNSRNWGQPNYNTQTVADNTNIQTFQNEGSGLQSPESPYSVEEISQQNNNNNFGKTVKNIMPKITLSTAPVISAAAGMVNYMDSINTRKREQERLSKQLKPVVGALPINQGLDMPMYAENGMEIRESNTTLNPQNGSNGYNDEDFEVPLEESNVIVEAGETVVHNDGGQTHITGDKHSDYSGGEYRNYPEGSRIFSKKLKASKELVKSVSKRPGIKARLSYADLVKQFNADKENEVLNNPNIDGIAQRTAEINKQAKLAKVDQIFDEQETVNGNKEREMLEQQAMIEQMMIEQSMGANGPNMDNQQVVMANGGRVRIKSIPSNIPIAEDGIELRGGYGGRGIPQPGATYNNLYAPYTPEQEESYEQRLRKLLEANGGTWDENDLAANQRSYFETLPDEVLFDYFVNQVDPVNQARRNHNITTREEYLDLYKSGKLSREQLLDDIVDNKRGVRIPEYVRREFNDDAEYMKYRENKAPLSEQNNLLYDDNFNPLGNAIYHEPSYNPQPIDRNINMGLKGEIQNNAPNPYTPLSSSTTPTGKDIDREKRVRNKNGLKNVVNRIGKSAGNTFSTMNDYLPEMIAAGLAVNDFPIFTHRVQPKYMQNEVMNVQPALNRNFSQAQPLVEGTTGNASIDNARANQVMANVYSADNEIMGQKFNFDTQNRQQVSNMNVQNENQANQFNVQLANQMADKMAMREHNKNVELNRIANSAYAKSKQIQGEKRAINSLNKLYLNRLQVDENGNPNFITPTDLYNLNSLTGQDPMTMNYNMIAMQEQQRRALMEQAARKQGRDARKNDGIITGGTPPYKTGGKVKTKYKINR